MHEEDLRFDGRVAVVTGGGSGVGREYAQLLAARGASVVVNDTRKQRETGSDKRSWIADELVHEIISKGGKAVANYDSVEDGEKLILTGLEHFGRIDIVINNGETVIDGQPFEHMSDLDWDIAHRIKLRGAFMVTRAAWPHMKKQSFGRVILTSSAAGLRGDFGQAHYSAAEMGLVGLCNTLAREGMKYNITCNVICPIEESRLSQHISPGVLEKLRPEYIAPVVAYLCHEECDSTASVYQTGGGCASKWRWQRTNGKNCLKGSQPFTPEMVRNNWKKICDFDAGVHYPSADFDKKSIVYMLESVVQDQSELDSSHTEDAMMASNINNTEEFSPPNFIGRKLPLMRYEYTWWDVVFFALSMGVSTRQPDHLKFLYEMHDDFCAQPTFAVKAASPVFKGIVPVFEQNNIDQGKILHSEHYFEAKAPMATEGNLTVHATIVDVLDKKSGALFIINVDSFNEQNEHVAFNQMCFFILGAGGFGGKRKSSHLKESSEVPSRPPDSSIQEQIPPNQAILDKWPQNPLHVDPVFAARGGFSKPLVQGLCLIGYAGRHVLKQYANNDVAKFKAMKVRFSKPVYPGDTIRTDMWQEGSRIHFESKVVERGDVCISRAYVDLAGIPQHNKVFRQGKL